MQGPWHSNGNVPGAQPPKQSFYNPLAKRLATHRDSANSLGGGHLGQQCKNALQQSMSVYQVGANLAVGVDDEEQHVAVGGGAPGGAHAVGVRTAAEEARADNARRVVQRHLRWPECERPQPGRVRRVGLARHRRHLPAHATGHMRQPCKFAW